MTSVPADMSPPLSPIYAGLFILRHLRAAGLSSFKFQVSGFVLRKLRPLHFLSRVVV